MKINDLIGKEVSVIPSYIDTYNAIILDTNGTYFILEITEIPKGSSQKCYKVGDIIYQSNIGNFRLINK